MLWRHSMDTVYLSALYTRAKRVPRHVWEHAVDTSPCIARVIYIIFRSFRDALCKFITCWFSIVCCCPYCDYRNYATFQKRNVYHKLFCFSRTVQDYKKKWIGEISRPKFFLSLKRKNEKLQNFESRGCVIIIYKSV